MIPTHHDYHITQQINSLQKGGYVEQLLIHLWGDYITQTDWMAQNKTKRNLAAFLHATVYTLPFLLLTNSFNALFVIGSTHYLIDRYRLARYVIYVKNLATNPSLLWADCCGTGYNNNAPAWLATWLLIIADNTLHLTINYLAISYL
jgi:hypothetical protein